MSIINQIGRYYDVLLKLYWSYGHFCFPVEGFFSLKTFSHISIMFKAIYIHIRGLNYSLHVCVFVHRCAKL